MSHERQMISIFSMQICKGFSFLWLAIPLLIRMAFSSVLDPSWNWAGIGTIINNYIYVIMVFYLWGWLGIGAACPEWLWSFHLWRNQKSGRAMLWTAWCSCPFVQGYWTGWSPQVPPDLHNVTQHAVKLSLHCLISLCSTCFLCICF